VGEGGGMQLNKISARFILIAALTKVLAPWFLTTLRDTPALCHGMGVSGLRGGPWTELIKVKSSNFDSLLWL
jgi:hypothetical protein